MPSKYPRTSRRSVLKSTMTVAAAGVVGATLSPARGLAADLRAGKKLIVYFSRTGNTRAAADQIHDHVGGDLFEVRTVAPYPEAYRATTDQARRELDADARPAIVGGVSDIASYDVVLIGFPNWWGTMPMALFTFLDKHDLSGKTLIPFCTHEGSRLGRGLDDLRSHCRNATVLEGLALRGGNAENQKTPAVRREIAAWLTKIGVSA